MSSDLGDANKVKSDDRDAEADEDGGQGSEQGRDVSIYALEHLVPSLPRPQSISLLSSSLIIRAGPLETSSSSLFPSIPSRTLFSNTLVYFLI